jgi:hypothetical protein
MKHLSSTQIKEYIYMRYEDKAKREPSGIYKSYLIEKSFLK